MSTWDRQIRQAIRRADNIEWARNQAITNCRNGNYFPTEPYENGLERIVKILGFDIDSEEKAIVENFDPDGVYILAHDFRVNIHEVISWINKARELKAQQKSETEEQTPE